MKKTFRIAYVVLLSVFAAAASFADPGSSAGEAAVAVGKADAMTSAIAAKLDGLAELAPEWGLLLVFVFMAVESSFIPFPSEVVMIPAGFLSARGEMQSLWLVIAAGILGSLAGAFVNYYLALFVGRPFLERWGKWFFIKREPLDRACAMFNKYGAATTFVCRLVPVVRQLISIPAGISRMPIAPFTFYTALGAGIWTALLAVAGYSLGKGAGEMSYLELCVRGKEMVCSHTPAVIAVCAGAAAVYFLVKKLVVKGGAGCSSK